MLVVFLSSNIHAVLAATLVEQLFLAVVMEEDINVAFNLLGGRPINLAIVFSALLLTNNFLVPFPTSLGALCKVDCAGGPLASAVLTQAHLHFFLGCIALHVSREEGMVRCLAGPVLLFPSGMGSPEFVELPCEPGSIGSFAISDFCTAITFVAIPNIWAQAIFCWAVWPFFFFWARPFTMKSTTSLCHDLVFAVHVRAATNMIVLKTCAPLLHGNALFVVLRPSAIASSKAVTCEAVHVLLVCLVLVHERILNTPHKHITNGLQSIPDVFVELPCRLLDGFLDQILDQGLHVCHISMPCGSQEG
jgi:hypothetical protein